jgi:hypothetical protein
MRAPVATVFLVFLVSACGGTPPNSPGPPGPPNPPPARPETFVGAGDIGWCGLEGAALTAAILDGLPGATVYTLGDNAYFDGSRQNFAQCYDPFWGRHKDRTLPTPGNHDYHTPGAMGYFTYFGSAANPPDGYYSYQLGAWRIFALNSEISAFPGSPQHTWLRQELAAFPTRCALAYFHTPVFGSGANGSNPHMQAIWTVLYEAGVDVVISAHDHNYERFAAQDPSGRADPQRGIRQFVVGTGGIELTPFRTIRPNSEVRNNTAWGVLRFTLHADRYDWQFMPVAGQTFTDSGNQACH